MMRLLLVNPNTNTDTTAAMLAIARDAAPPGVLIEGATAPFGVSLITDEAALAVAADAVANLLAEGAAEGFDGVIVAAFGDPGLSALRRSLAVPVTGIAEASMAEAAEIGPFAIVTTTPALAHSITRASQAYGYAERFRGVRLTDGDPHTVMADASGLVAALAAACRVALARDGASAIIIGGGPLAAAALELRSIIAAPIIEPIPAGVRLAVRRARS